MSATGGDPLTRQDKGLDLENNTAVKRAQRDQPGAWVDPSTKDLASGRFRRGLALLSSLPSRSFFGILLTLSSDVSRKRWKRIGRTNALTYFLMQRVLRINSHVPWPVHWSSTVSHPERIELRGYRPCPGYGPGQYIQAINGIIIGRNVRLGPGIALISADHDVYDYERHVRCRPIVIGDDVWLGADVKVLPGVVIGQHVIVAAGAVVTHDLPDDCIAAGVPAKIVKRLGPYRGARL